MDSDLRPVDYGYSTESGMAPKGELRTVCFVGSAEMFSEIVLSTVEAGLERVRAIRMPDMPTLSLLMQEDEDENVLGLLCTVVADERNATALMAMAERAPVARFDELKRVIAFEDDGFACGLLAHDRARLVEQRISLLPMNTNITTWVNLLRLIGSGGHYVPPHLLCLEDSARLHAGFGPRPAEVGAEIGAHGALIGPDPLTPREAEVLEMAAEGAPNKSIAHALDLSEHTVKLHMHRVIAKLGVKNRTEAAAWLHQRNEHA